MSIFCPNFSLICYKDKNSFSCKVYFRSIIYIDRSLFKLQVCFKRLYGIPEGSSVIVITLISLIAINKSWILVKPVVWKTFHYEENIYSGSVFSLAHYIQLSHNQSIFPPMHFVWWAHMYRFLSIDTLHFPPNYYKLFSFPFPQITIWENMSFLSVLCIDIFPDLCIEKYTVLSP